MSQVNSLTREGKLSSVEQAKIMLEQGDYIRSDAYWVDPVEEQIHRGEYSANRPNWGNVVFDKKTHERIASRVAQGSYNDDIGAKTAGYSDEMYPLIHEFIEVQNKIAKGDKNAIERNVQQGGMLDRRDYVNVKTLQVESRIILAKPKAHVLLSVVERVPTTEFSFKWYKIGTPYDVVAKKVSPQQIFHTGSLKYETDTQTLDIYGAEIGTTWEFRQETFDVPIYQHHLQNLEGQFERVRNEVVADVINAVGVTGGGSDWDALSGSPAQNTNNPIPELETLADLVNANNLQEANTIVSNKAVWRAFASSTPWVVGNTVGIQSPIVNPLNYQSALNYIVGTVPRFEGFRWVVDSLITNEEVTVMNPEGIRFWDGPQRTITWTHTQTDEEGTIFKAYFSAKNVETKLQKKYAGILS